MHQWMSFEALTPIQQVSVIRAACSFHLDMSLDFRGTVHPQFRSFRRGENPLAVLQWVPVALFNPSTSFVGVPFSRPAPQLVPKNAITSCKGSGGDDRLVVGRPSPDDRVEFLDDLWLGG